MGSAPAGDFLLVNRLAWGSTVAHPYAWGRTIAMPDVDRFDFDVFISYSSRDKAWVRGELLRRIEQAGLKAFIDFRDFARGAPSIKECECGVEKCRRSLIIRSEEHTSELQ